MYKAQIDILHAAVMLLASAFTAQGFGSIINNYVAIDQRSRVKKSILSRQKILSHTKTNCSPEHVELQPLSATRRCFELHAHTNEQEFNASPSLFRDYISLMRPVTILQANGAFIVGRLVILRDSKVHGYASQQLMSVILASLSIYLSYGAGMVMNDCADAALDAAHGDKRDRSVASGRISRRGGWVFGLILSLASMILAQLSAMSTQNGFTDFGFFAWNGLNILLMASYALGMQKLFLIKNLICGWLATSPLIGASMHCGKYYGLSNSIVHKLYQLAFIGFPLQVSREILKDIEDMETDKGNKRTLPLVIGETKSKRIAYGLVALINVVMIVLPHYWSIFSSKPPMYAISVAVGAPMCIRASMLPLLPGQRLLKKSIYVLLFGMISGLLLQK